MLQRQTSIHLSKKKKKEKPSDINHVSKHFINRGNFRITRMSSVLPFFCFAPMFMLDYLKFQGYTEEKKSEWRE